MIFKHIVVFTCMIVMAAGIAHAQMPASLPTHDPSGEPYTDKYYPSQPQKAVFSLIRIPGLKGDQFIIRITDAYEKSRCAKVSDYGYTSEYKNNTLDITLLYNIVDMRDMPKHPEYECNKTPKAPVADIIVSREALQKNQVKKIIFRNGSGVSNYNIALTNHRIIMLPDESNKFSAQLFSPRNTPGRRTPLAYWFYPENTLIMWTPEIESSELAMKKIHAFAKEKEMVPLKEVYPEFSPPLTDKRYMYFVDKKETFKEKGSLDNGKQIGEISIEKTVYGLEKDEITLDKVAVYAKRPGLND